MSGIFWKGSNGKNPSHWSKETTTKESWVSIDFQFALLFLFLKKWGKRFRGETEPNKCQ
jgi:hypothetical protein